MSTTSFLGSRLPRRSSKRLLLDAAAPLCPGWIICPGCHVKWLMAKGVDKPFLSLADACVEVGYWLGYFNELVLVIILKLNKMTYSTPRSFHLIVLVNTLGKLIEKMISNRLQFDTIAGRQTLSPVSVWQH